MRLLSGRQRLLERDHSLTEIALHGLEVAETPARGDEAIGMFNLLRDTDCFSPMSSAFVEISRLSETPREPAQRDGPKPGARTSLRGTKLRSDAVVFRLDDGPHVGCCPRVVANGVAGEPQ